MTPDQIEAMARGIASAAGGPPWWSYLIILLVAAVGAYLGAYLLEKGKNVATKEDIEKITDTVEAVRRQHQEVIENLKAGHQLRMVAAERRLQAHQEAFTLWRALYRATHTPEINEVGVRCLGWWESNCVYLGPKSHKAFHDAASAALRHPEFLKHHYPAKDVTANWQKILDAPNVILEEVSLPTLKLEVLNPEGKDAQGPTA